MDGDKVKIKVSFDMQFDGGQISTLLQLISEVKSVTNLKLAVEYDYVPAEVVAETKKEVVAAKEVKAETRGRKKKETAVEDVFPAETISGTPLLPGVAVTAPALPDDPFAGTEEPVAAPAEPTVDYVQFIRQTAAKVQTKIGMQDPAKINAVMAELNAEIKATYPQYQHVLMVKEAVDQMGVVKLINTFLKKKGI